MLPQRIQKKDKETIIMKKTVTLNCCIGDIVYKICPKCNYDTI